MRRLYILVVPAILLSILFAGSFVIIYGIEVIFSPETHRISVIVKTTNPDIAFWQVVSQGLRAAAKEYDLEVSIDGPFDEIDIQGQIEIMERAVQERPSMIILAATDYNALAPSVEKAHNAGIKMITFDSDVNSPLPLCFIATDNIEAGRKAGKAMAELVGFDAPLVILSHVKGTTTAIEREKGVRMVFEEQGSQAIRGTYFCDNFFDRAYEITRHVVTEYPWIRGIIALNEVSTVGAAKALRDMNLGGKVRLVGFDHSIQEIKAMEDGILDATVVQKPFNMGYIAVQMAKEALSGRRIERYINTGSVLITRETMYTPENQKLLFPFTGAP